MAARVADIMSRATAVIQARSSVGAARACAAERDVHHVLVLEGDALVGIVCRCDLDLAFDSEPIVRCMRTPTVVAASERIDAAARLVLERGVGCLAVVDERGAPRGTVTRSDLRMARALPGERGVDVCAACGESHCFLSASCPGSPVFCGNCLDQVRDRGARELYFTLGGGD